MIKRPNKYVFGVILSTALLTNNVVALENTQKIRTNDNLKYNSENSLNLEEYKELLSNYIESCKKTITELESNNKIKKSEFNKINGKIKASESKLEYAQDGIEIEKEYYDLIKNMRSLNSLNIDDINTAKSELQDLIDDCTLIYDDAVFGDEDNCYPIESGSIFIEAIRSAETVLGNIDSSLESLIEAKTNLEEASALFLSSKIDMNALKAELLDLISNATEVANNANIGFEIGNFPIEAKENLLNAINSAEIIYNNPTNKPSTIKATINSLTDSIDMFKDSVITEVDKSKLISKITEMEVFSHSVVVGFSPGQYPSAEKEKFDNVIKEAKNIVGTCTYQELLEMIDKLDEAKATLESKVIKYEHIDRSVLNEQITIAEKLKDGAEVGNKPGQYPQEALNQLYAAIYSATEVRDRYSATQDEVTSAANAMKSAIDVFKNSVIKKPEVDMSELMGLINQAEQLIKNTPVGNEINEVPEGEKEKLQTVVDSCKIIVDLSNPTQDVVNNAANNLKEAIIEFRNKIKTEVYKEALSDEIKKALSLQNSITDNMIGDEVGMYPLEAKEKFDNAIKSAQELYDNTDATQDAVDLMVKSLAKEVENFKNSLIVEKVDKTALKEGIKEAEKILKSAVIGNEDGMYPQVSYDALKSVLDSSKIVAESLQVTQAMINVKLAELKGAVETFLKTENIKYKEHQEELQLEVTACEELYNSSIEGEAIGEYPKKIREKFKLAIGKAKSVLTKNSKNSNEYIKALKTLLAEKEAFQEGVIDDVEIEKFTTELTDLLKEISETIKSSDVGSVNGGVPENKKIALSVMHSRITSMSEDTNDIAVLKEAIKLSEYSLSDFNDRSIYINEKKEVHGRKLTGKVGNTSSNETNVTVVNKEEFIPQAGLPIDVKGLMTMLGTAFVGIGITLRKKDR